MFDASFGAMLWLYISLGYAVAVSLPALTVTLIAKSSKNRLRYGALFFLSSAVAGFQLCAITYYAATSESVALEALRWQWDCALLACAVIAYLAAQLQSSVRYGWVYLSIGAALLIIGVLANHFVSYSLHFDKIEPLRLEPLPGYDRFSYFHGRIGWLGGLGFLILLVYVGAATYWLIQALRQERLWSTLGNLMSITLVIAALVQMFLVDLGLSAHMVYLGFALTLFIVSVAVGLSADAVATSRRLLLRDRQMEGEIRQRRKAEDKLERLSQVFKQAPAATHIVDLSGKVIQVNEESIRVLRRDASMPPKVDFLAVLVALDVDKNQLLEDLKQGLTREFGPFLFTAGVPVDSLYTVRDTWFLFKISPIFNQLEQLQEFVVRLEDMTDRQFVENAIKLISTSVSAETGQAFFTQLALNLARLLHKKYVFIGLKVQVNGESMLRTQAAAIDGELVDMLTAPLKGSPSQQVLECGVHSVAKHVSLQYPSHTLLRDLGVQSYLGIAITDQHKARIGVIEVMDVKPIEQMSQVQQVVNIFVARAGTELQRIDAERQNRKMAFEDYLTGLPNRTQIRQSVADMLNDPDPGKVHAFIQMDLDHFKTINDALGHDVGDEVLCHIADRLRSELGDDALLARIGGDEFALIVANLGANPEVTLARIAQRVIQLTEQPVQVRDHLLDLGCSMGIVVFPEFASSVVDVFRYADIALNRAKSGGRGGYQIFSPQMRELVSKRLVVEKGLRSAIAHREFSLFYQPQLNGSGELIGAEALARWQHPQDGWVPPAVFIPVAEETGLINVIGRWVLETAVGHLKKWFEQGLPFKGHLSINVSPWQFARPDFVAGAMEVIQRIDIAPHHITLELTESALITDVSDTIQKLTALREFGFSIALDDFGTGYSSLAYLRDLPLDILKIDKAFVDALELNAHEPLVESMVSIGRHMGLQVIAEGVETEIQRKRLLDVGCSVFQGHLFSKPLPEDVFTDWLKSSLLQLPKA